MAGPPDHRTNGRTALANESNLKQAEKAWLIFGVDNHSRMIIGSTYRQDNDNLNSLKHQISQGTDPSISFINIQLDWTLKKAKDLFAQKHANRFKFDEIMNWTDTVFLDRAKLTINGQITRTTLLLLGKSESAYYLSPYPAQMTWKLEGEERAYEHFGLPFILTTSALYQKIESYRNPWLAQAMVEIGMIDTMGYGIHEMKFRIYF